MLALNGNQGIPQKRTLGTIAEAAPQLTTDIVPGSAHTLGDDNLSWVVERLTRFFDA